MATTKNEERSERAYRALLVHSQYTGERLSSNAASVDERVIDFLTDLQHMLVDYSSDFDELARIAKEHYEEESKGA